MKFWTLSDLVAWAIFTAVVIFVVYAGCALLWVIT